MNFSIKQIDFIYSNIIAHHHPAFIITYLITQIIKALVGWFLKAFV
nr:MAG TPA: hypothetical protein [Caudoviricetes sp.]